MPADRSSLPLVHHPVGDLSLARRVASDARSRWRLHDEPALVRASMNATFRCGDVALRVGRPTSPTATQRLSEQLTALGVAVPEPIDFEPVIIDGLTVTAQRWISGHGDPIDWAAVGRMVRVVHDHLLVEMIDDAVPISDPRHFPWWDFTAILESLDESPLMTSATRRALADVIDAHMSWRERIDDEPRVCHGDIHPGNVIQTADGPVILDWDLLCVAPIAWDHAPLIAQSFGPWQAGESLYRDFAQGYERDLSVDPSAVELALLRDLAATLMRVRVALSDDGQTDEARLRLERWVDGSVSRPWSAQ